MTLPDLTKRTRQPMSDTATAAPPSAGRPIFAKTRRFFAPDNDYALAKEAELYPYFRPIEVAEGTRAVVRGRKVIMAGSNNYLGLTNHPRVVEAAQTAIAQYGTGCTGSRFLNGTLDLHLELERRLADFMGKENCVLFSTGYMTNQGVIQGLAGKGDLIFSDKDNHACIVAGTQTSLAETVRYRHDNMKHLRLLLEKQDAERPEAGKLIVLRRRLLDETGTLAKVPELLALAREFDAALMLDDAHAIGVVGDGGRGAADVFGAAQRDRPHHGDVLEELCLARRLRRREPARHRVHPPRREHPHLQRLDAGGERGDGPGLPRHPRRGAGAPRPARRDLRLHAQRLPQPGLRRVGEPDADHPGRGRRHDDVLPVLERPSGGGRLRQRGRPAGLVPKGQSLMRTSYMATHTDEELDFILGAFERVGLRHGVIGKKRAGRPQRTGRCERPPRLSCLRHRLQEERHGRIVPLRVYQRFGRLFMSDTVPPPSTVTVRAATSGKDRSRFLDFPYRHYAGHPFWVAPLRLDQAKALSPKKNPFFEHGEVALFLAEDAGGRDRRPGGGDRQRDAPPEVRRRQRVLRVLRVRRGLRRRRGAPRRGDGLAPGARPRGACAAPVNPTMNDTSGLLVEGFDREPVILMPYNPPYYVDFLARYGFRRAMTMWAYYVHEAYVNKDKLRRGAELVMRRNPGLRLRTIDLSRYMDDAHIAMQNLQRGVGPRTGATSR